MHRIVLLGSNIGTCAVCIGPSVQGRVHSIIAGWEVWLCKGAHQIHSSVQPSPWQPFSGVCPPHCPQPGSGSCPLSLEEGQSRRGAGARRDESPVSVARGGVSRLALGSGAELTGCPRQPTQSGARPCLVTCVLMPGGPAGCSHSSKQLPGPCSRGGGDPPCPDTPCSPPRPWRGPRSCCAEAPSAPCMAIHAGAGAGGS